MSQTPESVLRMWFDEVWNQGREDAIHRLMAADAVAHGLPGAPMKGPDAFRGVFAAFRGAFPDIHITIDRTVTQGELVAVHCRVTGTHSGGALGMESTGRQVSFEGMTMVRVVDGQIREGWNCFNFLDMYQQLGVLPALPGA
jgi:steroid delta-isomerase-like uncharacterized protein